MANNTFTSFTNPLGVCICTTPCGVLLSYSIDSSTQVELHYQSLTDALKSLDVENAKDISGFALLNLHYQSLAA